VKWSPPIPKPVAPRLRFTDLTLTSRRMPRVEARIDGAFDETLRGGGQVTDLASLASQRESTPGTGSR